MEKVIRDGKVAVVFSPGHGAGWYTWNKDLPEIIFDPNIVHYVELEDWDSLRAHMELKYPDVYMSEYSLDLAIMWLPEGTEFKIDEYDGAETIVLRKRVEWLMA
jgi:hypothetical protein